MTQETGVPSQPDARPETRPAPSALRRAFAAVPWHIVGPLLSVGLFVAALVVLARILQKVEPDDVIAAFESTPDTALLLGILATFGSYLALAGYDGLALRQVGVRGVSLTTAAIGSFTSYAISYTLGFPLLTAAAVRYRVYGSAGLSGPQIAALTLVCTLTFWLGMGTVLGFGFLTIPDAIGGVDHLPQNLNRLVGVAILGIVVGYTAWVSLKRRVVTIEGWSLHLPGGGVTLAQIGLGMIDATFAAAAFYVLLPVAGVPAFPQFVATFVFAAILGSMSHAPGGIGVFEATMLIALPDVPRDLLLGKILLFRVLYYFLPFALALAVLGVYEVAQRRHRLAALVDRSSGVMQPLAPFLVGGAVFLTGMAVLITGAVPVGAGRRNLLSGLIPLPLVEAGTLVAAASGVVLLFLARGLFRRLAAAWLAAGLALGLATLAVVLRGIDLRFAVISAAVMAVVLVSRPAFPRTVPLFTGRIAPWWGAAIALVMVATVAAAWFSLRNTGLTPDIWFASSYADSLPRVLRGTAVAVIAALAMTGLALRPRPAAPVAPGAPDRQALAATSPDARARLILLPEVDLHLGDGAGAVAYAERGGCRIALGDPLTPPLAPSPRAAELFWSFREAADRDGLKPVVLMATAAQRDLYVEAGLAITPIGERARLDLPAAGAGTADQGLVERQATIIAWGDAEALSLDLVPPGGTRALMPALGAVDAAWRAAGHRERFCVGGRFDAAWLAQNPCAVLRRAGEVVGFAVVMAGDGGRDLALDTVRLAPDLGPQALDFLLMRLMRLGSARGATGLDLGLIPSAEAGETALGPAWALMTPLLYGLGDQIADPDALRAFVLRLSPALSPRFLASPGGFALPQVLAAVTALIETGPQPPQA